MSTTEKHVCPPDHRHDQTSTCYGTHGCRCADCRRAHRDRTRSVYRAKAYGQYQSSLVPALGAHRRVQALVRQGWSQSKLAAHLGMNAQRFGQIMRAQQISRPLHAQIDEMFRHLWDKLPPHEGHRDLIAFNRAKRYAAARHWPRPLDWDDIDLDEAPPAVETLVDESAVLHAIDGDEVQLTPKQRRRAVEILNGRGLNDKQVAARLHCADRTVLRIRQELGLPHNDDTYNTKPAQAA